MGVARKITNAWVGVNGVSRKFWQSSIPLSDIPVGSRIYYVNEYYTLIAKDYCVSGDAILWKETVSTVDTDTVGNTMLTPFGASNTNQVSVIYNTSSTAGNKSETVTAWGWVLPLKALNYTGTAAPSYGLPAIPYFSSNERRKRSQSYKCYDSVRYNSKHYVFTVSSTGSISQNTTSSVSTSVKGGNRYYAFSVKGTLLCAQNSDGTYTLLI